MIEKERLEELIKQKATIWSVDWDKIILNENSEICKCYSDFAKNNLVGYCLYALAEYDNGYHDMDFDTLYETEEEMNWQLEFGNITRTETLNLPTWEEVFNQERCLDCYTQEFAITQSMSVVGIALFGVDFTDKIIEVSVGTDKMFVGDLSKENYTLACRKAKELFLGENENENEENKY